MNDDALALPSAVVTRARAGDPKALEGLYRTYETAVYNLVRRMCRSDADAEDVVQETFMEVCRSIDRFRGDGSFWSWLRQVAVSKALMHLRRERRRRHRKLDEEFVSGGSRPPEPTAPISLERALERLPEITRAVLWLYDVEGYTHREIAEMMGKSPSFSKSQVSRAHRRLREWLK